MIFQGFPGFGGFGDGFQLSFGIGAFPFAFFSTVSLASFNLSTCFHLFAVSTLMIK